jgi:trigger factor
MQIAQQGIPYDQYLKMTGMDESKLLADAKEPAERQVRMSLTVAALIKAENLEVSDEDVARNVRELEQII